LDEKGPRSQERGLFFVVIPAKAGISLFFAFVAGTWKGREILAFARMTEGSG
jgi:hypothetical protein